jgi:hypothetical protein
MHDILQNIASWHEKMNHVNLQPPFNVCLICLFCVGGGGGGAFGCPINH